MAKLTWLPEKTFELEFAIPWPQVKTTYDQVLQKLAQAVKLKGFRKGKAPQDLVEKSVDKGTLYGEVINQLLPLSYAQAIKQHGLKPAVAPKITIIKAKEGSDWQFKAQSCELPEVKLGDYVNVAKATLNKQSLWTPDKGDPKQEQKKLTDSQKLDLISQALLQAVDLRLPPMLVDSERDRLLSRLLDQITKLGLTIDQFAVNNNKTVDQIKAEYSQIAANTLKLELILQAIADDKNFKAENKDIDQMIASSGDDKLKKQLNTPSQRAYIASVLRKKQVIDYLVSLG